MEIVVSNYLVKLVPLLNMHALSIMCTVRHAAACQWVKSMPFPWRPC